VFDPDREAALELDMWQAYYAHENLRLFRGLVTLLHEQYRYPWGKSLRAGFYLTRAARTFGDSRSDYERAVPDLERAYAMAKDWTGASFDSAEVARAELAWWVARRVPGQDSPDHVGRLIARENALLFGVPDARVLHASVLRARPGRLRDGGGTPIGHRCPDCGTSRTANCTPPCSERRRFGPPQPRSCFAIVCSCRLEVPS